MIKFYYNLAPNPMKVALCLEEMGLPYEPIPIDSRKGEQHAPAFRSVNPNGKVPAIVDGEATVFDSNAILIYLGEKTGKFVPASKPALRGELLSWMMFIASGIGPFSGQAVHFKRAAPEQIPYAVSRYDFEARRHWGILNARLESRRFLVGEDYSIVDMALWGWERALPNVFGDGWAAEFPNVQRHFDEIGARPAATRAAALKDRHSFKTEMDEEARLHMFPHLKASAA